MRFHLPTSGRRHGFRPRRWRSKARRDADFARQLVGSTLIVAVLSFTFAPRLTAMWHQLTLSPEEIRAIEQSRYFSNCAAAREAGATPIYTAQPGYREELDRDRDGIACEPYRGR